MEAGFQREADFSDRIPELGAWNNGSGITPDAWIQCVGSYKLAIGYSLIFWPQFVVIDDYVLRQGATKQNLDSWKQSTGGNSIAAQSVINHMHISDLHCKDVNESQVRHLGRILYATHKAKLSMEFPDRTFVVRFNDEPGLNLLDYELTFWQVRDIQAD